MPVVFKRKLPCELSRVPYLVTPLSGLKGDVRPDRVWFPGGFVLKVVLYSKKVMLGCKSHFFLNGKIVNFKHLGMLS